MMQRHTLLDRFIINFDQGLRTVLGQPIATGRANPASSIQETALSDPEKQLAVRLMRVNHAGEVSAQALYQGQSLVARNRTVHNRLQQSAFEENDHLVWCKSRVQDFDGHVSLLNPLWYAGSLTIGVIAGIAGDKWSLGFVVETEHQVIRHLDEHLKQLPATDLKSRAILEQMKEDEAHHATVAIESGGVPLPALMRWLMKRAAKVMTKTA
ncbi:MAG: demethoxyubiquinone hydroxylase family protein, partial [Beggiatoa sp. IS2]